MIRKSYSILESLTEGLRHDCWHVYSFIAGNNWQCGIFLVDGKLKNLKIAQSTMYLRVSLASVAALPWLIGNEIFTLADLGLPECAGVVFGLTERFPWLLSSWRAPWNAIWFIQLSKCSSDSLKSEAEDQIWTEEVCDSPTFTQRSLIYLRPCIYLQIGHSSLANYLFYHSCPDSELNLACPTSCQCIEKFQQNSLELLHELSAVTKDNIKRSALISTCCEPMSYRCRFIAERSVCIQSVLTAGQTHPLQKIYQSTKAIDYHVVWYVFQGCFPPPCFKSCLLSWCAPVWSLRNQSSN